MSARVLPEWLPILEAVPEEKITATHRADVIIVGFGHAGTCAARAAAEAGASVIVLEYQKKTPRNIFGNEIGTINSQFARSRGVQDYDPLDLLREWQKRNLNRTDPDLIRQFAWNCGATLDWFLEPLSQDFRDSIMIFCHPGAERFKGEINGFKSFIGTAQFYGGGEYSLANAVLLNQERFYALGGQAFFRLHGEQPILENGRVAGVLARDMDSGEYVRFLADKGVLLAAGDFSRNAQMVQALLGEFNSFYKGERKPLGMGRDGSGIQLGILAGGRLEAEPRCPSIFCKGSTAPFGSVAFLKLNEQGKRYTDEGFLGSWGVDAQTARQPKGKIAVVFDSNWREELQYQAPHHGGIHLGWPELMQQIDEDMAAAARGVGPEGTPMRGTINVISWEQMRKLPRPPERIFSANTIEELAGYLGYSGAAKENFLRSVERYNTLCAMGRDEDFGKDESLLHPIVKPPFFGLVSELEVMPPMCTLSGLVVDEHQQVLDDADRPIPGLFASGNCCGGRFSIQYTTPMAGVQISMAQTMGRLAGEYIASL